MRSLGIFALQGGEIQLRLLHFFFRDSLPPSRYRRLRLQDQRILKASWRSIR
jgi:hypothetical protein